MNLNMSAIGPLICLVKWEVRKNRKRKIFFLSGWSCLMFPVVLQHRHSTLAPLPLPPLALIKHFLSEKQEKNNLKISSQRGSRWRKLVKKNDDG